MTASQTDLRLDQVQTFGKANRVMEDCILGVDIITSVRRLASVELFKAGLVSPSTTWQRHS